MVLKKRTNDQRRLHPSGTSGLSRFILVVEQLTHGWSIDPERKKPVKVPTIPKNPNSNLRKAVKILREEKRPFVQSVYHQEYVWLIRSSCCNTDAELELMWTELLQAETTNDLDWTYSNKSRSIMAQHKMKKKTSLPSGVKQKSNKRIQKSNAASKGPRKGTNIIIAPKKAQAVQQSKVGAEVTRIINEKNEEMVRNRADNDVGRNQPTPKEK
uniref:Uncharacterized protein n=1 Tax=Ditylenchus dipsaci TaxID=166011 RepID=A0A915EAS4_9BILA